ncbi:hypothetical protein [Nocardia sp. NBC_01009]|uniref:hypothetical protein n=1 Tax=Nocardia sp. NBC_01009 TaxID=2975996 RepID=UPI00386C98E7|nr:hypothetical protein OHA42_26015 [Nocardia sp. NBC_01009]
MDSTNAAARLLAEVLAAGFTVDGFIRALRADPNADTIVLPPLSELRRIPPPGHSYRSAPPARHHGRRPERL